MTRELFIETIKQIEKQAEYDDLVALNLSKAFPNAFEANLLPENHFVNNQLVKILQIETGDSQTNESWIYYFMTELDFGRDYHVGVATRKDGTNIDLSTSGKLYDFLAEQT